MTVVFATFQKLCFNTDCVFWNEARVGMGGPRRGEIAKKKVEDTIDDRP